ncbi:MAG: shikimate kinase [Bacteroidetes bacterium]|nr:MAG: shikimate kinase [Bacteroidota bacterium]
MQDRVFLIGFMGSGKTTLGRRMARLTGYDFVDMDELIEETAGMTISGIFTQHGEAMFRKWERDILLELCNRNNVVISTGGGAPCRDDMMDIMNASGQTVYLQLDPAILCKRLLESRTRRPLIEGLGPKELEDYVSRTLKKRESYYRQAAYIVDGSSLDAEKVFSILSQTT